MTNWYLNPRLHGVISRGPPSSQLCFALLFFIRICIVGRDSSVDITTDQTVEESNPGGGEIFCTVPDRPWAHPASCTMGTGSFPGVKRPGRGVDHSTHLVPRLKKEQSYTCTTPLSLRGLFQGELSLPLFSPCLLTRDYFEINLYCLQPKLITCPLYKGCERQGRFSSFLQATKGLRVSRGIALLFLGPRHSSQG